MGSWTGSLVKPHLAGSLKATQIALEMPAAGGNPGQPQFVRMDSVEAAGSYSPAQIAIQHAQLLRGKTRIALSGTLDASPRPRTRHSTPTPLCMRTLKREPMSMSQTCSRSLSRPVARSLPLAGAFNARIQADGPLHAPTASGSVEMDRGNLYGEPFAHLRIQGAMANQVLKLTSATLSEAGGTISASGSYDFKAKSFQVDAHGAGIDISRIGWVRQHESGCGRQAGILHHRLRHAGRPAPGGPRGRQRAHPGRAAIRHAGS